MKELCDKFNKIIDTHLKLNRGTEAFSARLEQRATAKLFRHILAQVYSRAVTDPDKLRDYEPFSPSVRTEKFSFANRKMWVFFVSRFMVKHHQI
jgi:H3 lysine-79-specific histone-lysine N-methyltransferase